MQRQSYVGQCIRGRNSLNLLLALNRRTAAPKPSSFPPHSNHRFPDAFFVSLAASVPPPSPSPAAEEVDAAPVKDVLYDRIMSSRSASSLSIFFRFFFGLSALVLTFFSALSGAPSALPFGLASAADGASVAAASSPASLLARFFSR